MVPAGNFSLRDMHLEEIDGDAVGYPPDIVVARVFRGDFRYSTEETYIRMRIMDL
jgi:hypothetical protein